jgi:hypothetical protein
MIVNELMRQIYSYIWVKDEGRLGLRRSIKWEGSATEQNYKIAGLGAEKKDDLSRSLVGVIRSSKMSKLFEGKHGKNF